MANALYPTCKASLWNANPAIDVDTDSIKCALSTAAYNSAHQYYSSVSASTVGTPQTLTSVTTTAGKFTSAAVSFSSITIASGVVILYKDTGSGATSPLIGWYDTGTAMPITVTSGTVTVTPDSTNGWAQI